MAMCGGSGGPLDVTQKKDGTCPGSAACPRWSLVQHSSLECILQLKSPLVLVALLLTEALEPALDVKHCLPTVLLLLEFRL